jgi:hypothetical protein
MRACVFAVRSERRAPWTAEDAACELPNLPLEGGRRDGLRRSCPLLQTFRCAATRRDQHLRHHPSVLVSEDVAVKHESARVVRESDRHIESPPWKDGFLEQPEFRVIGG